MSISLTVFFEDPFWIGVFERTEDGKLSVCKVTFGAEPKDYEVLALILGRWHTLEFSPAVEADSHRAADSPKRRQRNAARQMAGAGVGTKAQQALQRQREERKTERRETSREEREAEKQRQFELRQQKKREKHRGH